MRTRNHGRVMTSEQAATAGAVDAAGFSVAADIIRQIREAQQRAPAASAAGRGRCPPPANRGGKSEDGQITGGSTVRLVLEDGKIKEVPMRRGWGGDDAMVDWLNFTIGLETFDDDDCTKLLDVDIDQDGEGVKPLIPAEYVRCASRRLNQIFGYGVVSDLGFGQNFYHESFILGCKEWGTVSIGGQNQTLLVSITGTGLSAAKEGWEMRLYSFLAHEAKRPRITRIDLAHDDYEGSRYTVDRADKDHTDGLFNCGGRNPRCEYRGDWKNPDGKGRSFYIGNRKNGKFCRVYEKGREMGSPGSEWVRVEVEFKSNDRVIPFDVVLRPGEYLAASYPAFAWINERQERIETTQRTALACVEWAKKNVKRQYGHYIHYLISLFGIDQFLSECTRNDKEPAFMHVPHWGVAEPAIHKSRPNNQPVNLDAAALAW